MNKEFVFSNNGVVFTDSLIFAESFELEHFHVLEKIKKFTIERSIVRNEFILDKFINERNREYPYYKMTRKGFMFMVMNTGAKEKKMEKVWKIQVAIIDAFDKMESMLIKQSVNQQNELWGRIREQGKCIRNNLTGVIKDFVDYAKGQGSKNAERYYSNMTKMQYKALGFMVQSKPNLREFLDIAELHQIILAEDMCRRKIREYMNQGLHYKEIYILVKQDIESLAGVLFIGKYEK